MIIFAVLPIIIVGQTLRSVIMHLFLAIFLLLTFQAHSFRAIINLHIRDGPTCFYQFLMQHDKYLFNIEPYGKQRFRATVSIKRGEEWEEVLNHEYEIYQLEISKMARQNGLHRFCVSNQQLTVLRMRLSILMGIELAGFSAMPDLTDQQQLIKTIEVLEQEKARLIEVNSHFQAFSLRTEHTSQAMTTRIKQFIVVGLILIVLVNLWLYYQTKRVFNQRKLI